MAFTAVEPIEEEIAMSVRLRAEARTAVASSGSEDAKPTTTTPESRSDNPSRRDIACAAVTNWSDAIARTAMDSRISTSAGINVDPSVSVHVT